MVIFFLYPHHRGRESRRLRCVRAALLLYPLLLAGLVAGAQTPTSTLDQENGDRQSLSFVRAQAVTPPSCLSVLDPQERILTTSADKPYVVPEQTLLIYLKADNCRIPKKPNNNPKPKAVVEGTRNEVIVDKIRIEYSYNDYRSFVLYFVDDSAFERGFYQPASFLKPLSLVGFLEEDSIIKFSLNKSYVGENADVLDELFFYITWAKEEDEIKPGVTIAAGTSPVTEGADATFTLTATPTPLPVTVTVAVAVDGDYGITAGKSTVTIPTTGNATLTLPTTNDSVEEPNGGVEVTVLTGTNYHVAPPPGNSARVSITDNDDAIPPTVKITGVPTRINSTDAFTAIFTFSENVTGFEAADVTVTGGAKGAFASTSARSYTLAVTPAGSVDMVMTVAADAATDGFNTGPVSAVSATATWDATAPTVRITGVPARINSTDAFTAIFTFSENVTGFEAADVTVTGGAKGAFASTSARSYTLVTTPTGSADMVMTVAADAATDGFNTGPVSAVSATATWDAIPPTVRITGVPARINSTDAFTVIFTFSENVTGFEAVDVTVTGGAKGAFASTSARSYTLAVTPAGSVDMVMTVAADAATDGFNTGPVSAVSATATWDAIPPTVRITGVPTRINSTDAFTATFTFSENVTGFEAADVTVTGGAKGAFASTSARSYTLAVTPAGSADMVMTVAADAATDGFNTGPVSAVSATATWDATTPTVRITGVPTRINSTDAFTAIFTFSENVTGFEAVDVTVTGGAKGAFASTSARSYTLAVTPAGSADMVMTVAADAATDGFNTGPVSAVSATATWDATAPTVRITGVPTRINSTDAFAAIFTFSENVTGFEAADVTVTGGAKGAFASTSARSYTLAVTPTGSVDMVMTVAADAATDGFNTGPVSEVSATATWDATAPTVGITGVPSRINSTDAFTAIFTFSENVTGFEAADVTVTGGAKGAFASTSARSYTLAVTPAGSADMVMTVAADAATDGFNTGPVSAVSVTATWDATAPTVGITGVPSRINSTDAFTAIFTFSENVTGFEAADVTVTGGAKGAFASTSARSYTLAVTPAGSADMVMTVAADAATDGFNTGPVSAVSVTATWDATAPTVRITGVPTRINSTDAFTAIFTFSENVTGFEAADVTVTGGAKGAFASTSARSYTLAVTPAGSADMVMTVAADAATDGFNTGPVSAVSATATWDAIPPTVRITGVPARINSTDAFTVIFTFSENVTGFEAADVTVTGGAKGAFASTSARSYTLAVTPAGSADMVMTVAADAATDGFNTGPVSAVSATATWDAIAPTVRITGVPARINSTDAFTAIFTFSENVTGFEAADVTVTGGAKGAFASTSARSYTLVTTPTGSADMVMTVAADAATDGFNTGPVSAVSATATWDAIPPSVRITGVTPNPVDEGGSVTVTARLSRTLPGGVTIPVTLTLGTAESDDYDALAGITISSGQTEGTGTVVTVADDDLDDETFTVALGALPEGWMLGSPSSVEVTIRDRTPSPNRLPTVTASCTPCVVAPGGSVRLTATASDEDGDPVTYSWSGTRGAFTGPTDESVAHWTAPAELGTETISVEVRDGRDGSASAEVAVEVVNRPPVFEQTSYGFELPENVDGRERPSDLGRVMAVDPDGDALTYEIASGDREHFAVGALDGVVRYVGPGVDFETAPNRFKLTIRARDGFGAEAQTEIVVTVTDVNETPQAADDHAETPEDQAVTIDVLANDTDPEGGRLRIGSVTAAAHGAVHLTPGGHVIYTPEADFYGSDSFTYVDSDGRSLTDTATVEVLVLPVNDAPTTVGTIPDQTLDEGGSAVHVDLSPYFRDRDGDALIYGARSSDTGVVLAEVEGAVLALTPVVYGLATVTVTAWDPADLSVDLSVRVGVSDRPQRTILRNVLAATARSHLASVRAALGHRMGAGPCEASRLAVMDRSVPLVWTEEATAMLKQLEIGVNGAAVAALGLSEEAGGSPRGLATNMASETAERVKTALRSVPARALGIGGKQCAVRGRWSLWGQGDVQRFEGRPSVHGNDYNGELSTAYVGLDRRLDARWLIGVALSRSKGASDWHVGDGKGQLTQFMTVIHPYLRWNSGSTSAWASIGAGRGDARNARANGRQGTSPTSLQLGLVELERHLEAPGRLDLAFKGDAAWARLRTGEGEETIDRQDIAVNQVRIGVDLSLPAHLDGAELTPFGTVYARHDGGAGQTGDGIELTCGLRAVFGIVHLDAQARMLAHHSAEGYGERGAAVTLVLVKQESDEGFSLSVSPQWGSPVRATSALLHGPLGENLRHREPAPKGWILDARASYTVKLPRGLKLDVQGGYGYATAAPSLGLCFGTRANQSRMEPLLTEYKR